MKKMDVIDNNYAWIGLHNYQSLHIIIPRY